MPDSVLANALIRILAHVVSNLISALMIGGLFIWDFALTLYNQFASLKPANGVVPESCAGAGGLWPQYVPPTPTDSRSSCPALNAMANHGILPHSGRNISFRQLNTAIRTTYNFSPTFCFFVPNYAAGMLNKSYWTDTIDLEGLSVHNCIEHDASLTREDSNLVPDQSKPSKQLVEALLATATGTGGVLTAADVSRYSGKRRMEARRTNEQFSMSTFHRLFGSSNSSTFVTVFGGNVQDLKVWLLEDRIPDGWQSCIRHRGGFTLTEFQSTVLTIEFGIKEEADDALQSLGLGGWRKNE